MASPLKRARGNERVEDGSWHNDEEETNAARVRRRGENPREGTGKKGGRKAIAWVKPRGDVHAKTNAGGRG